MVGRCINGFLKRGSSTLHLINRHGQALELVRHQPAFGLLGALYFSSSNAASGQQQQGKKGGWSSPWVTAAATAAVGGFAGAYFLSDKQQPAAPPRPTSREIIQQDPLMQQLLAPQEANSPQHDDGASPNTVSTTTGNAHQATATPHELQADQQQAQAPAASGAGQASKAGKLPAPYDQPTGALAELLQRRTMAEARLRGYLAIKQRDVQTWLDQQQAFGRLTREQFEVEMRRVEDEVNRQTNLILYNIDDPNARRDYLQKFGCSKWSEKALQTVARYGPILELGAGLGHWQRELAGRGVDILAFDNYSSLPAHDVRIHEPTFVGKVEKGDEGVVSKHPRRTLLLVYPGPDPMAANALKAYKGNTLLYVGEGRYGVNATPEFFDLLEQQGWSTVEVVDVEPFPEGYEKLWVMQRKKAKGWLW